MSEKAYKSAFTKEQLQNMKACDIRLLEKREEYATNGFMLMYLVIFLQLVAVVAAVIWANKLTLFIAIVGFMVSLVVVIVSRFALRQFKDEVRRLGGKVK